MPDDIPDDQAATYFVNPATVLAMVRHVLKVRRGEWLLQSAAGSALGRMIIKLGRHDGFKTLNVVRRRDAIDELKALGGDAVISSEDGPIDEQVRRIVGDDGVRHAIDPVGGETGTAVFQSLAADGRLLLYGTLSGEPIRIDPRLMISGRRIVEGFWLGYWMRERFDPFGTPPLPRDRVLDPPRGPQLGDRPGLPSRTDRRSRTRGRDRRTTRQGPPANRPSRRLTGPFDQDADPTSGGPPRNDPPSIDPQSGLTAERDGGPLSVYF